jgi:hypothetical protein
MATETDALHRVLADVVRQLGQRGMAAAQVQPDRVVVALDDANTVQAWITAMDGSRMVSVQVRSAQRLPRDSWPTVLREVNAHNRDRRLTSAWLVVDDWETSDAGSVVVEAALPITSGHTIEQVLHFVDLVLADGGRFWSTDRAAGS